MIGRRRLRGLEGAGRRERSKGRPEAQGKNRKGGEFRLVRIGAGWGKRGGAEAGAEEGVGSAGEEEARGATGRPEKVLRWGEKKEEMGWVVAVLEEGEAGTFASAPEGVALARAEEDKGRAN